jgi:dihydroorotate dehydrogenase electron transfer subunit
MTSVASITAAVQSVLRLSKNTSLLSVKAPVNDWQALGRFVRLRAWPEPGKSFNSSLNTLNYETLPDQETIPDRGPLLDRPFSIHRINPVKHNIDFLIREIGPATSIFSRLNKGDPVKLIGPLGRGLDVVFPEFDRQSWYLAAGGAGLGPMASLSDRLGSRGKLFYGEKTGSAQLDPDWLKSWAPDFTAATDDGSGYGQRGLISDLLTQALTQQVRPIFACGPLPMLKALAKLADQAKTRLWVCMEAVMACGLGVCLSCSLPKSDGGRFRVCVDGPVIEASNVEWGKVPYIKAPSIKTN